jgi:hypothetical protein
MVDFSIKALTAPFVPPVERYFDRVSKSITSKKPVLVAAYVKHDFKVLMFNAASALLVTTLTLAYFKAIALVTAVAFAALFYFVRAVIDATFKPPQPPSELDKAMQSVRDLGSSLAPKKLTAVTIDSPKPFKDRIVEIFCQDNEVKIQGFILWKTTHYLMPEVIGMFLTRSP